MSFTFVSWFLTVASLLGGVAVFFYWKAKYTEVKSENEILMLENSELKAQNEILIAQANEKPNNHSPINDILDKL